MRLVRCAVASLVLTVCITFTTTTSAAAKETVVVLPVRGSASSSFDSSVAKLIEEPLKHHATIASLAGAMKAAHLKSASAGDAQKLGKAASATMVLVVEASGSKSKMLAKVSLVDVASGKQVVGDHYPMPDGKISNETAEHILSPIIEKLHPQEQPADTADNSAPKAKPADKDDKDAGDGDKLDPEAADAIDNQETKSNGKHWQPGYDE